MRKPDVVGGEVTSVHLESRIVVSRELPIGPRRPRLEMPATPEAVALGHLATHLDDLAIPGKLPEDSANSQGLELLNWSFSGVRLCRWGSCLKDLLFVVHARALSPRRWRQSGLGSHGSILGLISDASISDASDSADPVDLRRDRRSGRLCDNVDRSSRVEGADWKHSGNQRWRTAAIRGEAPDLKWVCLQAYRDQRQPAATMRGHMVRRGSTVRVRQRASRDPAWFLGLPDLGGRASRSETP